MLGIAETAEAKIIDGASPKTEVDYSSRMVVVEGEQEMTDRDTSLWYITFQSEKLKRITEQLKAAKTDREKLVLYARGCIVRARLRAEHDRYHIQKKKEETT